MSGCPVCGEGLGGYHETEVECRRCGDAFCPAHRPPDAHDCGADTGTPTGTFAIEAPGGRSPDRGGSDARRRRTEGARVRDDATEDADAGGGHRELAAVALVLLALYLLNVPLSYAGPLASSGYGSPWLYAVPGGLLVGYVLVGAGAGSGYHVWTNVTAAVLFASAVFVLFPAIGILGDEYGGASPHGAGYFLANGAPLLVYAAYRLRGWLFGR